MLTQTRQLADREEIFTEFDKKCTGLESLTPPSKFHQQTHFRNLKSLHIKEGCTPYNEKILSRKSAMPDMTLAVAADGVSAVKMDITKLYKHMNRRLVTFIPRLLKSLG